MPDNITVRDFMAQTMMMAAIDASSMVDWDGFIERYTIAGQRPEITSNPQYVTANTHILRMARMFKAIAQEAANQKAEAHAVADAQHNRN